jgi:hypothetical protein
MCWQWLVKEKRANPNVRNNGNGTPLHAAAMQGQQATAKLLCQLGIDTTLRNSQGNQARDEALHYQAPVLAQSVDHFTLARQMLATQAAVRFIKQAHLPTASFAVAAQSSACWS